MNTTEYQLDCFDFPPYLECHRKYFSIDNLNAFVSVFISKLISNLGFSAIQMEIDTVLEMVPDLQIIMQMGEITLM